jgi:RNA polymerase sigma-70 factor (ECF subfamily)
LRPTFQSAILGSRVHPSNELTELLRGWRDGDQEALARIVDVAYQELHKIAQGCLRNERPDHTLNDHRTRKRSVSSARRQWAGELAGPDHFFAMSAKIMRRILVDYARARGSKKRGAKAERVEFTESLMVSSDVVPEVVRLDDALQSLEKFDPRKARVVEMRYFAGLTANEIASVLGISPKTVNPDWSQAKAWLVREMSREEDHGPAAMGGN